MGILYHTAALSLSVLCVLIISSHQQQQGGGNNQCIEQFSTTLLACVRENGLSEGNFLWFVTNGTSKRAEVPANEDDFKTQICGLQQEIGGCVFQRVAPIMNSTACSQAQSQQEVIRTQLTTIFGTYDSKCMHPCRTTLAKDLRECYSSSGLDPNLFLSNSSNGAVVGSTEEQVNLFCSAKEKLISCMQNRADECPEAPQILRAIDLDIPSFDKGVTVLCAHPKVYLHGLLCFGETTNDVDRCQQREAQALIQLDMQARQGNWSEERFFKSFCEVAVKQIDCDLKAWSRKNHEACVDAVIGLRRELECELIPPECNVNPEQVSAVDHACHPEKFQTKKRTNFEKTGGQTGSATAIFVNSVLAMSVTLMSSVFL